MDRNFKFQVQDSFLEYFFWRLGDLGKRIPLSEKKPPLQKTTSQARRGFVISLILKQRFHGKGADYAHYINLSSLLSQLSYRISYDQTMPKGRILSPFMSSKWPFEIWVEKKLRVIMDHLGFPCFSWNPLKGPWKHFENPIR